MGRRSFLRSGSAGLAAWNILSVTGWGLWLVVAAGVVALLAPFMIARERTSHAYRSDRSARYPRARCSIWRASRSTRSSPRLVGFARPKSRSTSTRSSRAPRVIVRRRRAHPRKPVLIATNSTQKFDFLPIRWALHKRGVKLVTITKAKNYHSRPVCLFLGKTGVCPARVARIFSDVRFQSGPRAQTERSRVPRAPRSPRSRSTAARRSVVSRARLARSRDPRRLVRAGPRDVPRRDRASLPDD